MLTPLHTILSCPFCPHGKGELAIDLGELLTWRRANPGLHPPQLDPVDAPFALANPDGPEDQRCPHMISSYLDVMFYVIEPYDSDLFEEDRWDEVSLNGDHPWLRKNDPDNDLNIFLWELDIDEGHQRFAPAVQRRIIRVEEEYVKEFPETTIYFRMIGRFIVAAQPVLFLEQLRAGQERLQTEYSSG